MKEKYRERIKGKINSNEDGLIKDEHKKLLEKVREVIKIINSDAAGCSQMEETCHRTKKFQQMLDCPSRKYGNKSIASDSSAETAPRKHSPSEKVLEDNDQLHSECV